MRSRRYVLAPHDSLSCDDVAYSAALHDLTVYHVTQEFTISNSLLLGVSEPVPFVEIRDPFRRERCREGWLVLLAVQDLSRQGTDRSRLAETREWTSSEPTRLGTLDVRWPVALINSLTFQMALDEHHQRDYT